MRANIIQRDDKLDNCPCCGARADLVIVRDTRGQQWRDKDRFKVSCSKCGIRTCQLSSKAQAYKTWNRRKNNQSTESKEIEGTNTQYGWY